MSLAVVGGVLFFVQGTRHKTEPGKATSALAPVGAPITDSHKDEAPFAKFPDGSPALAPVQAEETADTIIDREAKEGAIRGSLSLRRRRGLTEDGVTKLATIKMLRRLDLSDTDLGYAGVKHLVDSKLTFLDLDRNPAIDDRSVRDLSHLPNLRMLSLASTGISDDALKYVAKAHLLERLSLANNRQITDCGIKNLNPGQSNLVALYLNGCKISDSAAEDLSSFKGLITLHLGANRGISDRTIIVLQHKLNGLENLMLDEDSIGDLGIHALTGFRKLKTLDLSFIRLSSKAVSDLATMKRLKFLYVKGCKLERLELQRLFDALPNTTIEPNLALTRVDMY